MNLEKVLERGRNIRVLGFDDSHHQGLPWGAVVNVAGVVCSGVRFEGMLWGQIAKDGMDATEALVSMFNESKFAAQVHLMLLDGLTFAGCDVIDLPRLAEQTGVPTAAVMRRQPDMERFRQVVDSLPESEERWRRVQAAGEIHQHSHFFYQVAGGDVKTIGRALVRLTDQGKVPEALRLAHLIGSAVMLGESGRRA